MRKEIFVEEMKNVQAENKVIEKYELENLRKKVEESEDIMRDLMANNKLMAEENKFYREEGTLKSEAIENLEKINQMRESEIMRMRIHDAERSAQLQVGNPAVVISDRF